MEKTLLKTTNVGLGILVESSKNLDKFKDELKGKLDLLIEKGEAVDSETANLLREVADQFLDRVDDLRNVSIKVIERVQAIVEKV